jgi:RNA polymerase sigma-70 factor (ECF subfamily)
MSFQEKICRIVNQRGRRLVYTDEMGPLVKLGSVAASMEKDATEIHDFDSALRAYRPRIFGFALASLRDRDAAESVTQDCFLKAHRAWDGFRGECSIQTWLMQIAVNLVRDVGRSRRFQFWKRAQASAVDVGTASDWIPDRDTSPEERVAAREQVDAIWGVLASLSEKQRTVFLLHFMEDMDSTEIEAATGITRRAVRVHLFRAVHAVRKRLGRSE